MSNQAREVFAEALELGTVLVARIVSPEVRFYRFEEPGDTWAAFTYDAPGTAWLVGPDGEGFLLREGWCA